MQIRTRRLGEDLAVRSLERAGDVRSAPPLGPDVGPECELRLDRHRAAVAHEQASRHRREAVMRRQEAGSLVERRSDEASVDEPRSGLVPLVEANGAGERASVGRDLWFEAERSEPDGTFPAAPAGGVVMRGNGRRQRSPPS
jgi:hypothetical protein